MALGRKRVNEAYAGQAYLQSVTTVEALQSALEHNGWDGDKRNIPKWLNGSRPQVENAWAIGEALRSHQVQGASGFAALWIFDYPGEAAAVLGMCDEGVLPAHRGALIAMIASAPLLAYRSSYDILPREHRALNGEADEWSLRQLADAEIVHPVSTNYQAEADLLNARFSCARVWHIKDELLLTLSDGVDRWFRRSRADAMPTLPAEIRTAYFVGNAPSISVPQVERHFAVQNLLVSWLAQIRPPTIEDAISFAVSAVASNTSESAALRSIIQCVAHVAEAIYGVRVEVNEMTLIKLISAYVESQVGGSLGLTSEVLTRAARGSGPQEP